MLRSQMEWVRIEHLYWFANDLGTQRIDKGGKIKVEIEARCSCWRRFTIDASNPRNWLNDKKSGVRPTLGNLLFQEAGRQTNW